ncbi:MAG: DUF2752 domain-containing protein [Clostridia bacterium]|nr:DUF2752 domain-containing protein [Clostridia bacterium]
MIKIKHLKEKILIGIAVVIGMAVGRLLQIPCVFLWATGYECLGCGMTRALISALRLDFISAFQHHRMFWSLPILGLYVLFDGKLFKNKVINIGLLTLILVGFIVNWVLNLVG